MRVRDLLWLPLAVFLHATSSWHPASAQVLPDRIARLIGEHLAGEQERA